MGVQSQDPFLVYLLVAFISFRLYREHGCAQWMCPLKRVVVPKVVVEQQFQISTVEQLITAQGFLYEKHNVTTSDGYILTLHRIPNDGTHKIPILLQHGVLDSGASWVFMDAQHSLAYLLNKAGFDVWMGNCRGASKHHVNHSYHDPAFWDWNTDDLIKIDLPAMVNYVIGATKSPKISYVGHSMGALLGFAAFVNENIELSNKIQTFVALAPAASFRKPESFLGKFLPTERSIFNLLEFAYNFVSPTTRIHAFDTLREKLFIPVCSQYPGFCREILCLIAGCKDTSLFASRDMKVTFSLYPAEASMGNLAQFAQWETSQNIAMYDYGAAENQVRYGSKDPKIYNISDLAVPVAIFYGGRDRIVSPYRVRAAIDSLPQSKILEVHHFPDYGHADFVWSEEGRNVLFPDIIELLQSHVAVKTGCRTSLSV